MVIIKNWFSHNDDYVWILFLPELVYDVLYGLKCLDMGLVVGHINCHMYVGHVAAAIEVRKRLGAPLKLQRLF